MPIRIATAPVSWGVMEVEGWARKQSYGEVLDEMVQAGYSGTELGPYGFLPTDSKELKRELAKRNMTLLGAFVPLPLGRPEEHREGMRSALEIARLLAANGAPFLVLADEMSEKRMALAGNARESDGFTPAQWEDAAKLIGSIAKSAQEIGVRSVFHHHAGTYIETPDEVARLLESTDPNLLGIRSEEHTSELQSLRHLVCRLLLGKKIKTIPLLHGDRKSTIPPPRHSGSSHA